MFTRNNVDRFATQIVSSLTVTVAIVTALLVYAVNHIQVVA